MDYNEEISSVETLAKCPNLIIVNVYGTKVTEVKSLTDQGIIVHYADQLTLDNVTVTGQQGEKLQTVATANIIGEDKQ